MRKGYINIKDIKNSFDGVVFSGIPSTCGVCGSELIVRETLTGLTCGNNDCPSKVSMKMVTLVEALDIKGFGASFFNALVLELSITNPVQVFLPSFMDRDFSGDSTTERFFNAIKEKTTEGIPFSVFLRCLSFPNLGNTNSRKLASVVNNRESLYGFFSYLGVDSIKHTLGIKSDFSVIADSLYTSFKDNAPLLSRILSEQELAGEYFILEGRVLEAPEVVGNALETIYVCASDSVGGGFAKKSDFYDYITEALGGKYNVEIVKSVTKKLNYLLWDGGRETSKVIKARKYNESGSDIKILDAGAFMNEFGIY